MMRKIILQQYVTIDGFAAGPNGELDFVQGYAVPGYDKDFQADAEAFLDTVDTMMLGTATYKMFAGSWPEATEQGVFGEKLNSLSKVVASSTLESAPWGEWEAAEITDNPVETIKQLKQQKGKNVVVWGSLTLAQSLMKDEWIDECQLRVCPVALGSGRRLFIDGIPMELMEAKAYDKGLVLLRYEPGKKNHSD